MSSDIDDEVLDLIHDLINERMVAMDFSGVDDMLSIIHNWPFDFILTFLVATIPCRQMLTNRQKLIAEFMSQLNELGIDAETVVRGL